MTATTVNSAEAIDAINNTVPTESQDEVKITAPAEAKAVFNAEALIRKACGDAAGNRDLFAVSISKLAQGKFTLPQLSELLEAFMALETTDFQQMSGLSEQDTIITGKLARHYLAGAIIRSLDEHHNALRSELCDKQNGHGVYVEAGPLGHAGLGLGVVSKETKDGMTTVKRTGAGVYFRADHLLDTPVVASKVCAG
jgi:hypothetical protein